MTSLSSHTRFPGGRVRHGLLCLGILLGQLSLATHSVADEVLVAVASNFIEPMTEIAARFSEETGHQVNLASGASGRFVAQIRNGAPFQVFLSADQGRVEALIESGHALEESQFTYAVGSLVLWSAEEGLSVNEQTLGQRDFRRLAIANPNLAPYGRAAVEVLESLAVNEETRSGWVQGENISQTFQFVQTGNAELGFVAASQVTVNGEISRGSGWKVPQSLHSPIYQDAVLLVQAADCQACRDLLSFLRTDASRETMAAAGYQQR